MQRSDRHVGLGQPRPDGYAEPPLVTLGQDFSFLGDLTRTGPDASGLDYMAADVIAHLLGGLTRTTAASG